MNAPEEPAGRSVSQESWQAAPVTDPNAALWASITPPANPSLQTLVRRRVESFSLELLAHRLFLRYPSVFRSRSSAQNSILAGVVALGAGAGLLGYFAIGALLDDGEAERVATGAARAAHVTAEPSTVAALPAATAAALVGAPRHGESSRANDTQTLAATARATSTEQTVQALEASPALDDDVAPTKAKRAKASKHKKKRLAKARARRSADRRSAERHNADRPPRNAKARALARMLGN